MIELKESTKSEGWDPTNSSNIQSFTSQILKEFFDKGYDERDAIELLSELICLLPYYYDSGIDSGDVSKVNSEVVKDIIDNLHYHVRLDKYELKKKI